MSRRRVFVVGVGMTKFEKPLTKDWDYPDMGYQAASEALSDAGLSYSDVQAAVASYCYGEPTCGQRALYRLGLTGVPVFNVNNNCSSGSSALMLSRLLVQGAYDCVLAVGFEKMERGLSERYPDKVSPVGRHVAVLDDLGAAPGLVGPGMNTWTSAVIKMFAYAAREHFAKHKTNVVQLGKITEKNRRHGANNPRACLQKALPLSAIVPGEDKRKMASSQHVVCDPITLAMSALTADGGAAAIVCSEEFVVRRGLQGTAVEILDQEMTTDLPSTFNGSSGFAAVCGVDMSRDAAQRVYRRSGLGPNDVDVLEVHDCFSCNELFMYEALGLCQTGEGGRLVDSGRWVSNREGGEVFELGKRWVVNPSGGIESKGHPIGATGLAQCAELNWQLRGIAGKRQVDGAQVALQHNFGLGGAAVVTLYRRLPTGEKLRNDSHWPTVAARSHL